MQGWTSEARAHRFQGCKREAADAGKVRKRVRLRLTAKRRNVHTAVFEAKRECTQWDERELASWLTSCPSLVIV